MARIDPFHHSQIRLRWTQVPRRQLCALMIELNSVMKTIYKLFLVTALLGHADLAAQELSLRDSDAPDPSRQGVLVLHTGNVVKGELTPRPGGYEVKLPNGQMLVAAGNIKFAARDMDDAYRRMRSSFETLSPDVHLRLARWCLSHHLEAAARRETLDALHLDPNRQDAKGILESLARRERQQTESARKPMNLQQAVAESMVTDRLSLGGLPAEQARQFTLRIQPIMINKCAQCHAGQKTDFRLVRYGRIMKPRISEQNLAAVLSQVDLESPDRSPLLVHALKMHGGSRRPGFPGRSGSLQLDLLRTWVRNVALHLEPTLASSAPASSRTTVSQVNPEQLPAEQKFLYDARAAARRDDFDPSAFNRRYHSGPQATGVTPSLNPTAKEQAPIQRKESR